MKTIKKAFAITLKTLREGAGLSQAQLGHRAGLDRTFISLLERGVRQPTITTMCDLCHALEIDLSEMILHFEDQRSNKV